MKLTRANQSGFLMAIVAAALSVPPVMAQEEPGPMEEITVTGSYVSQSINRPSPVTVLDNEQLQRTNVNSIAEIFKELPQALGSVSTTSFDEGDNSPTNSINLRGLGPRATLVLLNGRRQTVDASANNDGLSAVDINNLAPAIMLQQIEIVTDGASALYGSDAVAGVANFRTRNDFEGGELRFNGLWDEDGIGTKPEYSLQGIFGARGAQGTHIVAGFEWTSTETILVEDRLSDNKVRETLSSVFGNPGNFKPAGTSPSPFGAIPDPLCGDPSIGDLEAGRIGGPPLNLCTFGTGLGRAIVPDKNRFNGLAVITHEFDNEITAQVEVGFSRSRTNAAWGFGLPAVQSPRPLVPANNPGVIAANAADPNFVIQDYQVFFRPRTPFDDRSSGRATQIYNQDTFRIAGTIDGPVGNTGWDFSFTATYSGNESRFRDDEPIQDRLLAALPGFGGPNCDPATGTAGVGDCKFWNPFANAALAQPGDPEFNDPEVFEWFNSGRQILGDADLTTFDLLFTNQELFQLPGGPVGLAIGGQWRQQDFFQDFDDISNNGGFAFNSQAFPDFGGRVTSKAGFWELSMLPVSWTEVQAAGRFETDGENDSYDSKIGFVMTPPVEALSGLSLRASWGKSFRAASETQRFGAGPGDTPSSSLGGQVIQARGQLSGNPDLAPEKSTSYAAGLTWQVNDYFTMNVGFWRFDFENLIVSEDAEGALQEDIADGFIDGPKIVLFPGAPNEVCEVTGTPAGSPSCVNGFDIAVADLLFVNEDKLITSGIDLGLDFNYTGFGGIWGASLAGTWVKRYDLTTFGTLVEGVGSTNDFNFAPPVPEFRGNASFTFSRGNHYGQIDVHFVDAVEEQDPQDVLSENVPMTTVDLQYEYTLPVLNGSQVIVSVTNLFDTMPPFADNGLVGIETRVFDQRSRRWGIGWVYKF